jgi:hypothetical protein
MVSNPLKAKKILKWREKKNEKMVKMVAHD